MSSYEFTKCMLIFWVRTLSTIRGEAEYSFVNLSLTGKIFTQKSDNWFNQKKRKVYDSLHIYEKDKKLQSIWESKCQLLCKHFELLH